MNLLMLAVLGGSLCAGAPEVELWGWNLVKDPSFELGDRHWLFGNPESTRYRRRSKYLRDFVRRAHSGNWALRLNHGVRVWQELSLKGLPSSELTMLAYSRAGRGELRVLGADGRTVGTLPLLPAEKFELSVSTVKSPKNVPEPLKVVVSGDGLVVDDVEVRTVAEENAEKAADLGELEKISSEQYTKDIEELRKRRLGKTEIEHLYCRIAVSKEATEPISFLLSAQTGKRVIYDLEGFPHLDRSGLFRWSGYWIGALPVVQFGPPGEEAHIRPGESSAWIDLIPPVLPSTSHSLRVCGRRLGKPVRFMDFAIEFALKPEEGGVFFKQHISKSRSVYIVVLPGARKREQFCSGLTDEVIWAERAREALEALPEPEYGRRPELFELSASFVGSPSEMGREFYEFWLDIFSRLGLNTVRPHPEARELVLKKGLRLTQYAPVPGNARSEWLLECDWEDFERRCRDGWKQLLRSMYFDRSRPVFKAFGNETNSPGVGAIVRSESAQEWFRRNLRQQGLKPEDFAAKEWSEVRPCTRYEYLEAIERNARVGRTELELLKLEETKEEGEEKARKEYEKLFRPLPYHNLACGRLFYWTNRFRFYTMIESYRIASALIFKTRPEGIKLDVCRDTSAMGGCTKAAEICSRRRLALVMTFST